MNRRPKTLAGARLNDAYAVFHAVIWTWYAWHAGVLAHLFGRNAEGAAFIDDTLCGTWDERLLYELGYYTRAVVAWLIAFGHWVAS